MHDRLTQTDTHTHLCLYARRQRLDDLVDRMGGGCGRGFLVLLPPARWSGDDSSGRSWVQTLTVWVLVERCVPRLRLVLPNHEPRQRQVLHWQDRKQDAALELEECSAPVRTGGPEEFSDIVSSV